jgi:putative ABC transport system permease protein
MVIGGSVTPGYFGAMRIDVVRGRDFTNADGAGSEPVIVVSETFAAKFWPHEDPIGHRVQDGDAHATVVGVVRDVKQGGVLDAPEPQFYRPVAQKSTTTLAFAVRVREGDPTRLAADVRRIVAELDPELAIYNVRTAQLLVDNAMLAGRTFETLMIVLGCIALALATAGVYAVTSFLVSQRIREMGLRAALGADARQLIGHVFAGSAFLAVVGAVTGIAGAVVAARLLAHSLYSVRASDVGVYVAAASLLVVGVLAATLGPARRAALADPMAVLRDD